MVAITSEVFLSFIWKVHPFARPEDLAFFRRMFYWGGTSVLKSTHPNYYVYMYVYTYNTHTHTPPCNHLLNWEIEHSNTQEVSMLASPIPCPHQWLPIPSLLCLIWDNGTSILPSRLFWLIPFPVPLLKTFLITLPLLTSATTYQSWDKTKGFSLSLVLQVQM